MGSSWNPNSAARLQPLLSPGRAWLGHDAPAGSSAAKAITASSAEQPGASIPCGGVGNPSSFPPPYVQACMGPRGSWDLPELAAGLRSDVSSSAGGGRLAEDASRSPGETKIFFPLEQQCNLLGLSPSPNTTAVCSDQQIGKENRSRALPRGLLARADSSRLLCAAPAGTGFAAMCWRGATAATAPAAPGGSGASFGAGGERQRRLGQDGAGMVMAIGTVLEPGWCWSQDGAAAQGSADPAPCQPQPAGLRDPTSVTYAQGKIINA